MKKVIISGIAVLLAIGCVLVAGCGSSESNVEGVYKLKAGDTVAVLTLKSGGEAIYSLSEDLEGLSVDYKVEEGKVTLIGADGKELTTAKFTIEEKGLRDSTGNLWEKE